MPMDRVCILLATLNFITSNGCQTAQWLSLLEKHVTEDVQYKQVVLVLDISGNTSLISDEILHRIIQHVPTVHISLSTMTNIKYPGKPINNTWMNVLSVNPHKSGTLFIFALGIRLDHSTLFHKIATIGVKMLDIVGNKPFPKMLLIIFPAYYEYYRQLFRYYWKLDILDFTILEVFNDTICDTVESYEYKSPILHQFNPFSNIFDKFEMSTPLDWFPDKLSTFHGYTFNIGIIFTQNVSKIRFDSSGAPHGRQIDITNLLSDVLNYKCEWTVYTRENQSQLYGDIKPVSKINFFSALLPYRFMHIFKRRFMQLLHSDLIALPKIGILVPVVYNDDPRLPRIMFLYSLTIGSIACLAYMSTYLLRFNCQYWKISNVVSAFVGMSAEEPVRNVERTLFAFILTVSVIMCSDMIGECTELEVVREYITIDTFADIERYGFSFRGDLHYLPLVGLHLDAIEILQKKSVNTNESESECVQTLMNDKNSMCLIEEFSGQDIADYVYEMTRKESLKMIYDKFPQLWGVYLFRAHSTILRAFNLQYRRLLESGLLRILTLGSRSEKSNQVLQGFSVELEEYLFSTEFDYTIPFGVMIIGYLFAVVIFVFEVHSNTTIKYLKILKLYVLNIFFPYMKKKNRLSTAWIYGLFAYKLVVKVNIVRKKEIPIRHI